MTKTVNAVKTPKAKSTLVLELKTQRTSLKALRETIKTLAAKVKAEREAEKAARQAKTKARKEAAIAKAKARLEALTRPVGTKAKKAAKKPGKVTVTKVATA